MDDPCNPHLLGFLPRPEPGALNTVNLDVPVHYGINGECRDRFYAEFLGDVLPVADDGRGADIEPFGNLLVYQSPHEQLQALYFAGREQVFMPGPVRGAMRPLSVRGTGWVRMFGRMSVAVQAQDAFCEILFALADVEALHAGQLRKVVAAGQDDRLGLPL